MIDFVSLHNHTYGSFLDGYGSPTQIAERLVDLGQNACAITDHGNTFIHSEYAKVFANYNIKPIFGVEAYICDNMTEKTRYSNIIGKDGTGHITLLAMNQKGYENLLKLVSLASREGMYYRPRIDRECLWRYQEGIVVLSGCVGGYPSSIAIHKGGEEVERYMKEMQKNIEYYYCEIIPEPGLEISEISCPIIMNVAHELKIPLVMTSDAHFPKPEDHRVQDVLLCAGLRVKINDPNRKIMLPDFQYYCSGEEILERAIQTFRHTQYDIQDFYDAIAQGRIIADMCNVELPKVTKLHHIENIKDNQQYLRQKAIEGLEKVGKNNETYLTRLNHEIEVFASKEFLDYIIIIRDLVQYAKTLNSIVVCRGSAGGSVLLYALGTSVTDPIEHNLSFERFYDYTRNDPPDVDIDFEPQIRDKCIQYLFDKYGRDKTCRLAALSRLQPKAALQDLAFVYDLPGEEVDKIKYLLDSKIDDFEGQIKDISYVKPLFVKYPELHIIQSMLGQYRQSSVHAAGILIANKEIENYISTLTNASKDRIGQIDKEFASERGFLKIDMLSVKALRVICETLAAIKMKPEELLALPLTDTTLYRQIDEGLTVGNFQLDGIAAQVGKQIRIQSFEELYAISALIRPGALQFVETYVENKFNPKRFERFLSKFNDKTKDIVRETYGILLYQEQVMRLCREVAGLEWKDVHKIRKMVAKSEGISEEYKAIITAGFKQNGLGHDEIEYWLQVLVEHGKYSFNKSHCVTYGLIGYWTLWLKRYHSNEFYTAVLSVETEGSTGDKMLIKRAIQECKAMGKEFHLLTPATSHRCFENDNDILLGGWENIDGIGAITAKKIIAGSPYTSWEDAARIVPKHVIEKFRDAGITGELEWNQSKVIKLAYWLPVITFPKEVKDFAEKKGFFLPGQLPNYQLDGNTTIVGYVTLEYKKAATANSKIQKFIWAIEDTEKAIYVTVSKKRADTLGVKMREDLSLGKIVIIQGWWEGSILYANNYYVIGEA